MYNLTKWWACNYEFLSVHNVSTSDPRVMWNTEMVPPEWHKSFSEYISFSFLQQHFFQLE